MHSYQFIRLSSALIHLSAKAKDPWNKPLEPPGYTAPNVLPTAASENKSFSVMLSLFLAVILARKQEPAPDLERFHCGDRI